MTPDPAACPGLAADIARAIGRPFAIESSRALAGGSISQAWIVEGAGTRWFAKLNAPARRSMFEAEAAGLAEIESTGAIRVPAVVCAGGDADASWLVLEYVEPGRPSPGTAVRLGRALAAMHAHDTRGLASWGWRRDNSIGSTPQRNAPTATWIEFLRTHRIGFQLALAARNGYGPLLATRGERLLSSLERFFDGHDPRPSLLHGDLWHGNCGCTAAGEPLVFDPAVYRGDREADIAMTELFGGFPAAFLAAYCESWPLAPGYRTRKHLYNLYHVLNHANLFGGGYPAQAADLIDRLLAET